MMKKSKHTFPKKERISHKKDIEKLFAEGKSFFAFPMRIVYVSENSEPASSGVSVLVNVPKRHFKKAVDRNRLKRLIRESYRLNKSMLTTAAVSNARLLKIAFLYTRHEKSSYREVEKGMVKALATILNNTCFS
jgi:ribonuclease P protein component